MKMSRTPIFNPRNDRGFSLVELLVVIAIVAILAVLALPAFNSVTVSRQLDTVGREVLDSLTIARQHALTFGRRVRWELVELNGEGGERYRAHRLVEFKDGEWTPFGRWQTITDPIQLNLSNSRTNLLDDVNTLDSVEYQGTTQSSVNFIGVTFLSDGTTLIPPSASHPSITFEVPRGEKDASGNFLNWVAIIINPVTGTAESYRP